MTQRSGSILKSLNQETSSISLKNGHSTDTEAALIVFSWYKYYFWTITQSLCTKSEQIMEIHVHWEQWEQKMCVFLGFNWTPIFSDVDFYKNAFAKNIYKKMQLWIHFYIILSFISGSREAHGQ